MRNRRELIKNVINDLESLRNCESVDQYGLENNIIFFRAINNILLFLIWLFFKARKIDGNKLLEINDLPTCKWDALMYSKLISIEKKGFPGLVTPLVNSVYKFIVESGKEVIKIASIGSGGMEVERQVINKLINNNITKRVIFVGIDKSHIALDIAHKNLHTLPTEIIDVCSGDLTAQFIDKLASNTTRNLIIQCRSDIFALNNISTNAFDLIFHTLFKHHLSEADSTKLDILIKRISGVAYEYDGYKSWLNMIPQIIIGWNHPVFLNAEIFSNLRFRKKGEIIKEYSTKGELRFFNTGYYMLKWN